MHGRPSSGCVALAEVGVRAARVDPQLARAVDPRHRAVGGEERVVPALHLLVRDREARRRVVVAREVTLRPLEHRNRLLGRAPLDVPGEAARGGRSTPLPSLSLLSPPPWGVTPPAPRLSSSPPAPSPRARP